MIHGGIVCMPANKAYRDNFDRVFGKKKRTKCKELCTCGDPCAIRTSHKQHLCKFVIDFRADRETLRTPK